MLLSCCFVVSRQKRALFNRWWSFNNSQDTFTHLLLFRKDLYWLTIKQCKNLFNNQVWKIHCAKHNKLNIHSIVVLIGLWAEIFCKCAQSHHAAEKNNYYQKLVIYTIWKVVQTKLWSNDTIIKLYKRWYRVSIKKELTKIPKYGALRISVVVAWPFCRLNCFIIV